jgi:hypothetical protein
MEVQFIGFPDVLWRVTGGGLAAVCQLEVSLPHEGTHDQVLSRSVTTRRDKSPVRTRGTAGTAGDAGAPHPVERHEQPRSHRGAASEERLAGDTGDRMATGPAGPGAHRRLRRPLTAASAAKVSINHDTIAS